MGHTLARSFRLKGLGVHSGVACAVSVEPADGGGIGFLFPDGVCRPLVSARIGASERRTGLDFGGGRRVETAEHLLASLYALGITDAVVIPGGGEVPILDGSALPFVEAIRAVGLRETPGSVAPIRPLVPVDASDPERGRTLVLLPGTGLILDYTIDYPGTPLGCRRIVLTVDPASFVERIAPARTFGFEAEAEALRARGLARGASLENTLVYGSSGVLNPEGERFFQEPPAHKALDLLGDLALLGAPLEGRVVAVGAGHDLHLRLAARLRRVSGDQPQNRKRREIE